MKQFPVGIYTLKQLIFNFVYTIFMVVTIISLPLILLLVLKVELWINLLTILGLVIGFVLIYIIANAFLNPVPRIMTDFNLDLDYERFNKRIEKLLNNKIHDDSRNYLLSLKANVLSAINKNDYIKLFEKINEPTFKSYKKTYKYLEIYYLINTHEYDLIKNKFEQFKKDYPKDKLIPILATTIGIFIGYEEINDVEKVFAINDYALFDKLVNANALMTYYDKQQDSEKALHYAKIILNQNSCLTEINDNAKTIAVKYNGL